jgi:hypothetical protein
MDAVWSGLIFLAALTAILAVVRLRRPRATRYSPPLRPLPPEEDYVNDPLSGYTLRRGRYPVADDYAVANEVIDWLEAVTGEHPLDGFDSVDDYVDNLFDRIPV